MLDPPQSRQLPSTVQLFVLGVIAFLALGATSPSSLLVDERSSVRHPVVVVGPLIGQTLQVNDARWLNPCSPWTPTWTTAWVNLDKLAATCALHSSHAQLGLTFDPTTHRTKSPEHVQVRVAEGWDGLTFFGIDVYGNLTQRLESEGFVRDVDILPMGYDWRLSVADWEQEAFPRFFRTISDAVSKNGQPVVLTGVSMAAPFTHAFLRWANAKRGGKSWVQKNVHAFVPVAGPFNGAVNALSALMGGVAFAYTPPGQAGATKFTCPLCDPPMAEQVSEEHFVIKVVDGFGAVLKELLMDWLLTDITRLLREFPSLYWMSPGVDDSIPNRSYVTLQHGPWAQPEEIKASGLPSLFRRLLMHDEAERMKYALSVGSTEDPGVPTHCIYSHNVRTFSHLTFPAGGVFADIGASVEIGDGDGTVHSDSLSVCERWKSTVKVYKLPGVHHGFEVIIGQVHDVIVGVAKGDDAALDAWTSPAFVDLDVPRDGMTNATILDEWQANLVVALKEDA